MKEKPRTVGDRIQGALGDLHWWMLDHRGYRALGWFLGGWAVAGWMYH